MTIKRLFTMLVVLATAVFGWSVAQEQQQQEQQDQQAAQQAAQQQPQAALRVAHLAPGAAGVEVRIDGEAAFGQTDAENVTEYRFVPAGEHQVEIVEAEAQQGEGEQQEQQEQPETEPGEVPEAVAQAVQNAQQAVQQGGEEAQQALDEAMTAVEEALANVDDQARPNLEGIQASLTEAQTALDNDDTELAQESVDQAQSLVEEAQGGEQAQPEQQQQDSALFSETMEFEAGSYYTVLAYEQPSDTLQLEAQEQEGAPEEQPEEEQPEEEQPEQEEQEQPEQEQQEQRQEQEDQQQQLSVRVIQDELSLPPAGASLLRVVHLSSDAPTLNLVLARQQQQDQQQDQEQQQQEGQQEEGQQQDGQEQEGQEQEGQQQMQQVRDAITQAVEDARTALEEEDFEGAQSALDEVETQLGEAEGQASEEQMQAIEQMRQSLDEARTALDEEDAEGAQSALDQLEQSASQLGGGQQADEQEDQEEGQQQDQQEGQEEGQQEGQQEGQEDQPGSLTITLQPEQASGATVNVTGPDGFEQEASSGETLDGLDPGTYVVSATMSSYQPAASEVEVQGGQDAEAELTLQRLASAGPPAIQGETLLSDVTSATASPFQPISAGTYTAQLRATDQDITAVELRQLNLQPGAAYTLFAYGSLEDDSFAVTITVDALVPQGEQAQQAQQDGQQQDGQEQEGQQEEGQQQEGQQEEAQQQDGEPQVLSELRTSVSDALDAVSQEDVEGATSALDDAESQLQQAMEEVSEERQQTLEEAQQAMEEARTALGEEDFEGAQQALQQVQERIQ